MSSRRRAKVTIRPKRLTADAIPRTFGTPNFCLKIGRRETPKVAPSLGTPDESTSCPTQLCRQPNGLHSNAAEPWNRPDSKQETNRQKQVDNGATLCESKVARRQSTRSFGDFDRSKNCRGKQPNTVRSNLHQKPGDRCPAPCVPDNHAKKGSTNHLTCGTGAASFSCTQRVSQ